MQVKNAITKYDPDWGIIVSNRTQFIEKKGRYYIHITQNIFIIVNK